MTLTPSHLRAKTGLSASLVSIRLGISLQNLRALESTPIGDWTVRQVAQYAAACGHALRLVAVRDDGHEEDLS
jgi:hypothetical protein